MAIEKTSAPQGTKSLKKQLTATAIHGTDGDTHIVGIGNLRVVICPDEDGWFAQGLEIDYAASGSTIPQVKKNFQTGLRGTINLHLQLYGNIESILTPAPSEIWKDVYWSKSGKEYRFSQVSVHEDICKTLGVRAIDFYEPNAGVAA